MHQNEREINQILDRGAEALEKVFHPVRAIHVGIDWQRVYCDPEFLLYRGGVRMTRKILTTLVRMNETVRELRPLIPTCWISHDPDLNPYMLPHLVPYKHFMTKITWAMMGMNRRSQKLEELRQEAAHICGDIHSEDRIFLKKDFNAYSNEDFCNYLNEQNLFILLLSGLVRRQCVRSTESYGAVRGHNMFIIEDLTVDWHDVYDEELLDEYKEANLRGSHCVRSDDVKAIVARYKL